jgi:nitrate reductase NapE component
MSEGELSKAIFPNLVVAVVAAFAAFCVWLGVRIANRRERWSKWTAAGLVIALVVYPISFGPACLLGEKLGWPQWISDPFGFIFFPILCAEKYGPRWIGGAVLAYMDWWMRS